MNRTRADAVLLLVALLWGTTFVAQKLGSSVGPLTFVAVRFIAAALFLLPLALWEARGAVRRAAPVLTRGDLAGGLAIGLCLCTASLLQQTAMATTSATNAGFLTGVYMVLVPFVAWLVTRRRPRLLVLAAGAIALYGAWLLAGGTGAALGWSVGDLLILLSDVIWAFHITLISQFRGIGARPMLLSCLQCALTGLVSLPAAWALEPASGAAILAALPAIAYAGIVSSGIAFTLQIVAQRHTPPAEAALIMSLESVFSALAGAALLGESMSLRSSVGAFLIMTGVVLVETSPLLLALLGPRPAPAAPEN